MQLFLEFDSILGGKEVLEMTFTYRYRKQIIFVTLTLVLLSVVGGVIFYKLAFASSNKEDNIVLNTKKKTNDEKIEEEEDIYYQVDIKGEVNTPGIYTVKKDSRVIDVIRLAGDLTDNADTSVLNLSKKVTDEMVIIIYSYDEVANFALTKEKEKQEQEACLNYSEITNDACIKDESEIVSDSTISLNTATIEELMTLPGIGEAKAKAIISYREEVGAFQNIEELKEVDGIGDTLFDQIKENITI